MHLYFFMWLVQFFYFSDKRLLCPYSASCVDDIIADFKYTWYISYPILKERLCFCRNHKQQQEQSNLSQVPMQSWYPPSVLRPIGLHRASSSPNIVESESRSNFQSGLIPQSPSTVFTATFPPLKDKRLLFVHMCSLLCNDRWTSLNFLF